MSNFYFIDGVIRAGVEIAGCRPVEWLMNKFSLWILSGLLVVSALSARAGYYHPYHVTTVSWVVATRDNLDDDDRYVTLIGHVTARIGDDEYWFTDGTGNVRLDGNGHKLPIGPKIVLGGRIDQAYLGFGHLEVDVRRWHFANGPTPPPGQ